MSDPPENSQLTPDFTDGSGESDPRKKASRPQPSPRLIRALLAGAIASVVLAGSVTIDVGLVTLEPGPIANASELVSVEGAETHASEGSFLITTVGVRDASLVRSLWGWASPKVRVLPREVLFPGDKTDAEINEETASQMNESQYVSTIAAFKELGFAMEPDGALVLRTFEGAVAAKSLAAGDIVTSFDGKAIKTSRQLREIARTKSSELVAAKFRRGADLLDASIEVSPEGDPIGVNFRQSLELPFRVKFEVGSIGGPSAGLTFALAIVNLLTPEDLTGGKLIADTGTITEDGVVGPIGGIAQKVAAAEEFGAEVFLSPKEHEEEARSIASESMTVIGVSTLREAIDALRGLK